MGDTPVQDVDLLHAAVDGLHAPLHLGDHAAGDDALLHQLRHVLRPEDVDEAVLVPGIPEEAPHVGEEDQLLRLQCLGQLGGGGVGVDVVGGVRVHALGHGGHHGDIPGEEGVLHRLWVHAGDAAHEAVLLVQALRLEQPPIHAAQAHRLAAQTSQLADQVLVHLPAQHRLDHLHGHLVGVAQAVHEPALVAQAFEHGGNFRSAAVDHHHADAYEA